MKYTFSDDEDDIYSDSTTARRSTRNTGTHTPAEPSAPTVTLSGRQVKTRQGGTYGESMLSGQVAFDKDPNGTSEEPEEEVIGGRPRRSAVANGWAKGGQHIEGYNNVDEMSSDEEGDASEQDYGDDEEEDEHVSLASDVEDAEIDSEDDVAMDDSEKQSLVVKLPVKTPSPERSTTIKLHLSPRKDNPEPQITKTETANTNDTPIAISTWPKEIAEVTHLPDTVAPTPPVSIPQSPQAPLSPLVYRGSPEKTNTFPPSINVGYQGS